MKPLVTVLTICYNQEKFIAQTLDGFVIQRTSFPFEVIVGDDASTDRTPEIIREYAEEYPDIMKPVLREKNLGWNLNFKDIASRAAGKYVAMCEGDDYWTDPLKLQKQADFLEAHPEYSVCFHPVEIFYDDNSKAPELFPSPEKRFHKTILDLEDILKTNFIQTNSVMYRWRFNGHEKIADLLPVGIIPGDWYLHILHAEKGKIGFVDDVMARYRKHAGGIWADELKNEENHLLRHGLDQLNFCLCINEHFDYKYYSCFADAIRYLRYKLLECFLKNDAFDKLQEMKRRFPEIYEKTVKVRNSPLYEYQSGEYELLKPRFAELDASYRKLEGEYRSLEKEYRSLESEYNDILSSVPWRITKPFRLVMKFMKHLFKDGFSVAMEELTLFFRKRHENVDIQKKAFNRDNYKNAILIFDHSLGGGANSFVNKMIEELTGGNEKIVYVTNLVSFGKQLYYTIDYISQDEGEQIQVESLDDLLRSLDELTPREIIYNSLVYLEGQKRLLQWVSEKSLKIPIRILLHDFYSLCPSYNLISANGKFCGLDPSLCAECYPRLDMPYMNGEKISLEDWRECWRKILLNAAEIRIFSQSSGDLAKKIYPEIEGKLNLQPHSMDYFISDVDDSVVNKESLILGVVGNITSIAKGVEPVTRLAGWMELHNKQLHIIGQFSGCKTPSMKITGKYNPEDLDELFHATGVNVVFFPSIWPETFSYLVSELIALRIPILSFDFGAQAEKIRNYDRGVILSSDSPKYIYREAEKLFNEIYRGEK